MWTYTRRCELTDGDEVKDDEVGVHGADDVHQTEPVSDRLLVFLKPEVDHPHHYRHGQGLDKLRQHQHVVFDLVTGTPPTAERNNN